MDWGPEADAILKLWRVLPSCGNVLLTGGPPGG